MKTTKALASALGVVVAGSALSVSAQTRTIKTAGQAVSLCKALAEKAHPGYVRSKLTRIT